MLRDQRGAAVVEYLMVLIAVSLGAALALVALGGLLLRLFGYQQAVLLLPLP